jgi:hypothetical protein
MQVDLPNPTENSMYKSIATTATAVAILSLGSLVSALAGGGATSAPSKYSNATQHHGNPQAANYYAITEFSSSSAKSSTPKR